MARWEIGDVEKLFYYVLSHNTVIKQKMGGTARISIGRVNKDPNWFPYIYGYCIPGPDAQGQGRTRIQSNPTYDFEVRTKNAFTQDTEDIIEAMENELGAMVKRVTLNGLWVVSVRRVHPISIDESGETNDIFYTRRGGSYKVAVVPA